MTRTRDSQDESELRGSASTSRSLLLGLKQNDAQAWNSLVHLYAPLVFYWCRRMNVPEQDIVDIFQEVFQSIATNISKFHRDQPGDTFRGWMRTITRNKVYDHYRRRSRQPDATGGTDAYQRLNQYPDAELAEDTGSDDRAHNELFHRALDVIRQDFTPRTWSAFWKVVVEGKSPQEAGEELSMRPGTVRVAKSRVLHRLRQQLGDILV